MINSDVRRKVVKCGMRALRFDSYQVVSLMINSEVPRKMVKRLMRARDSTLIRCRIDVTHSPTPHRGNLDGRMFPNEAGFHCIFYCYLHCNSDSNQKVIDEI